MSARRWGPTVETIGVLVAGATAIALDLLPYDMSADRGPRPDLVFCIAIAWTIRRPGEAALWAIVLLGLAGDVLLSRPIGLGALGLLIASEIARSSASTLRAAPFVVEWAAVAGLFVLAALGMKAALALSFVDGPDAGSLLRHAVATALAYPLVVLALAVVLGLRRPRRERDDRLGRIA